MRRNLKITSLLLILCFDVATGAQAGTPPQRSIHTILQSSTSQEDKPNQKGVSKTSSQLSEQESHKSWARSVEPEESLSSAAEVELEVRVTRGFFNNRYTFQIMDAPQDLGVELQLIEKNAIAVIEYISDYFSWEGTLDFVVQFRPFDWYDVGGLGLLPSFGGVSSSGFTWAAEEAITGVDANGESPDIGCNILPNEDGTLTNYGVPLSFDESPDFYKAYTPPPDTHDFASIFLHEVVHSMGFWSTAQHGDQFKKTAFDELTQQEGDIYEFFGEATNALLSQNLNLASSGSRDHYGVTRAVAEGYPEVNRGAMFEFGNYEQNRWHLGKIEIAVLKDIGWKTANQEFLNLVEQPGPAVTDQPARKADRPQKKFSNLFNTVKVLMGR